MFHYTKAMLKLIPRVIVNYFGWMLRYSRGRQYKYPIEKRYKKLQKLLLKVNKAADVVLFVEGTENIPHGKAVLYPNHLSGYDPLLLLTTIEEPATFVAKIEIRKWIVVNRCIDAIEGLYIDRDDLKQSLRTMMKVSDDLINKGDKKWIIFPEGTRNKDPLNNFHPFHHGSFKAAVKAQAPIVPVAMYGTNRVLKLKPQYKKYPIHIQYLKPLMPEEYKDMTTQEIAAYVQNEVDKAVNYHLRLENHNEMVKMNKKYQFNKL